MPPVVIGAGIAAVGTVAGGVIASKGAKSAAKAQQEGTNAGIAAQERAYGQSAAALAPWQQSGLQANSLLQDALGFNAGQPTQQQSLPTQQPNALAQFQGYNPDTSGGIMGASGAFQPFLNGRPGFQQDEPGGNFNMGGMPQGYGAGTPMGQAPQAQQPNARSAFDTFLDSTNYNWQLEQGNNAMNGAWAGAGTLQSGAAMKAFGDYNQNMARGAFQDWYGGVENMANRGFGAASAQAGVSQNLGNNTAALQSANARALSDLQIQKANALGGTINGLATIGSNLFGGMGKGK